MSTRRRSRVAVVGDHSGALLRDTQYRYQEHNLRNTKGRRRRFLEPGLVGSGEPRGPGAVRTCLLRVPQHISPVRARG